MKKLLIFVLFATSFSCQKQEYDDCIDRSLINDDAICNMDYNPVCGCDGETYSNACVAKYFHGITNYTAGPCVSNNTCARLENPSINFSGFDDAVSIIHAEVIGDCLSIDYSYSGGCDNHNFKLRLVPIFCGTPPLPPTTLQFVHEANNDQCKALLYDSNKYDLSSIRDSTTNQVVFYLIDKHNAYRKQFVYKY